MAKLQQIREYGNSKNEKELDIIEVLHLLRNLKEFVKNLDNGIKWKETKQKAKYLRKYIIDLETNSGIIEMKKRKSTISNSKAFLG